jgi:hypothetical protein
VNLEFDMLAKHMERMLERMLPPGLLRDVSLRGQEAQ